MNNENAKKTYFSYQWSQPTTKVQMEVPFADHRSMSGGNRIPAHR